MSRSTFTLDELKEYLAAGHTKSDAARHFGVSPQAIAYRLDYVPHSSLRPLCPRCGIRNKAINKEGKMHSYCQECNIERNRERRESKRADRLRAIENAYGIVGWVDTKEAGE